MDLNQAFASLADSDHITLDPTWAQGRALYGGLTGALMLAKLEHLIGEPRRLRSLTVSFVGPIDSTGSIRLDARILRVGKSVLQGEVHLWQNDGVQAVLLASFGEARPSAVQQHDRSTRPQLPPAESIAPLPDLGEAMPAFLQHLDLRWYSRNIPYGGSEAADFGGYMRFKNQQGAFRTAHLVALGDAFPPAVITLLPAPAPASSLTWTLEFLQEAGDMTLADFWQYDVHTDYAADGYGHSEAKIWDKHGRLICISRQTVTVFG